MLVAMRRIDIVTTRSSAARALRTIHRAGVLHLVPFETPTGPGSSLFTAEPGDGRDAESRRGPFDAEMERLADLAGRLSLPAAPASLVQELWELSDDVLRERVEALRPASRRATELSAELLLLRGEADRSAGYREIVEGLRSAIGHLPSVRGYGSTGIVVRARYRAVVGLIREELESLTDGRCEVLSADIDADRVAAVLIYPHRQAGEVRSLLGGRDIEEVTLPESLAAVPFDQLAPRLAAEEAGLRARAAGVEEALAGLSAEVGPLLAALRLVVGDRIVEARVLDVAGRSDHLVAIGGWIPAGRVAGLRERLAREVGPEVVVIERAPGGAAPPAPVAFENRRLFRPFEPLASFVSLPRYGTVDPTPAVAFAFPVFVGLMVADVGYGLVLLALLALARRRWRTSPAMAVIWPVGVLAGCATVLFGVLFGEWFGDAGAASVGFTPILFDRREAVGSLLLLAIGIGIAQIGLGLVLGVVNDSRLHRRRQAVGRAALFAGLAAGVVGIAALAGLLPLWAGQVALAVVLIALVVVTVTLGLAGPLELIGLFGNVLSYARLMAIGLASVMLAVIANRMGGLVEDVLLGFLIAFAFHALAIVLGFFDASVQGLRLQYVEFFGKFVEPGGMRYEPFASVVGDRTAGRDPAPVGGT